MGKITYYVKKKIGKEVHSFSVEGDNLFDAVLTSRNLSFNNVDRCGKCQGEDLELGAHAAKGKFKYVTIKCRSCKSYVNFGQQQENADIFYLRTRQEGDKKVLDWKDANTPMEDN